MAKAENKPQFDLKYVGSDDFHELGNLIVGRDFDWSLSDKSGELEGTFFYQIRVWYPYNERYERFTTRAFQQSKGLDSIYLTGLGMIVAANEDDIMKWIDYISEVTNGKVDFEVIKGGDKLSSNLLQVNVEFANEYKTEKGEEKNPDLKSQKVGLNSPGGFVSAMQDRMEFLIRLDFTVGGLRALGISDIELMGMVDDSELEDMKNMFKTVQDQEVDLVDKYNEELKGVSDEDDDENGFDLENEKGPSDKELEDVDNEELEESKKPKQIEEDVDAYEGFLDESRYQIKEDKYQVCPDCGGSKVSRVVDSEGYEHFPTCPTCNGEGVIQSTGSKRRERKFKDDEMRSGRYFKMRANKNRFREL